MRTILSQLVAFLLIQNAFCLDILFFSVVIGKSHMDFSSSLIDTLTKKNHSVDYLIAYMNSDVKDAGKHTARQVVEVSFPGISPWNSHGVHLNTPFSDLEKLLPMFESWQFFNGVTLSICDLVLSSPDFRDLLATNKYDLLIAPGYEFCGLGIAKRYDIPIISYTPTPISTIVMDAAAGLPQLPLYENEVITSSFSTDYSKFYDRVMDFLRTVKFNAVDLRLSAQEFTELFRKHYGHDFPDAMELTKLLSLELVNSHSLIELPRPIAYRTRYIGGINLRKPKKLDERFDDLLNMRRGGAVLVSFGTQVKSEAYTPSVIAGFTEAFKKFPDITFIWKFHGAVSNNSNIVTVDWLPQTDLLYDRRVIGFISHVGLNSLTEAAFAGVPLICIPMFADQNHNSRVAENRGIGVRVKKTNISADSMYEALHKILMTSSYRENSKKLSEMLSASPDTAERIFIESVEFAAKFKDLGEHLQLPAAHYPFLVHYGYDIVLFLAAASLLLSYVAYKIMYVLATHVLSLGTILIKIKHE